MAVMVVGDVTVKEVAGVPPKLTAVVPVKPLPVMVTVVPGPPLAGAEELIAGGGGMKVKPPRLPVPALLVTATLPEAAAPTTAVMVPGVTMLNEVASTPPKLTDVTPSRLVPLIVTVVPAAACVGVKAVIVGAG